MNFLSAGPQGRVSALSVFNMIAKKFKITFGTLEAATLSYVVLFVYLFGFHASVNPDSMPVFQMSLEMSIHVRHPVSSSSGGVCPGL